MSESCVIFAGGEPISAETAKEYKDYFDSSFVISADKGYELAERLGVQSDLIIGDFDSAVNKPEGKNVEVYPCEKDDTDLMLAIKKGFEHGCDEFRIFGATGGRLDHMIGNIQSLAYILSQGGYGEIISDRESVKLVSAGSYKIKHRKDFSLSLFAYSDSVEGLSISGVKYSAENVTLKNNFPLGISNVIKDGTDGSEDKFAHIRFQKGILLIIQSYLFTDL